MAGDDGLEAQVQFQMLLTQKRELFEQRLSNSMENVKKSRDEHVKNKKSLKSDLKKTTAFVKKIRNINAEGLQQCIRDTETLNLTLYISEIVTALLETAFKAADVAMIVKLCVSLHKRYDEFTDPLIAGLRSSLLANPNDNDADGPKKRRIQVRFLMELFLVGIFTDDSFFVSVIKVLLGKRKALTNAGSEGGAGGLPINKKFADLQGLAVFAKYGAEALLGFCPPKVLATAQAAGKPIDVSTLSLADMMADSCPIKLVSSSVTCEALREQLQPAYDQLTFDLIAAHKDLRQKERRFEKDALLHGNLSEEKQQQLDTASKFYEKLFSVVQNLSESTGAPMVELQDEEEEAEEKKGGLSVVELKTETEYGPYGDLESKQFYDDLPDFLATMPLSLFGFSDEQAQTLREKWKSDRERRLGTNLSEDEDRGDEEEEPASHATSSVEAPAGEADEGEQTTSFAKLAVLLSDKLPECVTKLKADQFCESFCHLQPTKGHRKKLVNALVQVPRTRIELTSTYSRIIASLGRIYPDISPPVLETLRGKFYGALKHKGQVYIDHKTVTIKYIAELAKFGVAPPMYVFRTFKDLLGEFTHHNVDLTARLMEECGRYFYLLPHTHAKMVSVMDTTLRLKGVRNLDMRQSALLESAYFAVKPPERAVKVKVEYTLVQQYARHLVLEKLNSAGCSVDTVMKALRRLPWEDDTEDIEGHVLAAMQQLAESKYLACAALADLLSGINRHLPNLVVRFTDALLESVHRGLEVPYRREPQKMVGAMRMIGELYNFEVLSSSLVYDTLYKIINTGHEGSYEGPSPQEGGAGEGEAEENEEDVVIKPSSPRYFFDRATRRIICKQEYDPRILSELDPPHDTFRAQLVCEILKTCGSFFVSIGTRSRLARYLTYFQRWLLTKPSLPVHVEYLILDTFDALEEGVYKADLKVLEKKKGVSKKRDSRKALHEAGKLLAREGPAFPRFETMAAVMDAIGAIEAREAATAAARTASGEVVGEEEEIESDDEVSDEEEEDEEEDEDEEEGDEEEEDEEEEDEEDEEEEDEDEEDEDEEEEEEERGGSTRTRGVEVARPPTRTKEQIEEDEDFDEAFREMMAESVTTAQGGKNSSRAANVNRMAIPAVLPRPKNLPRGMELDQLQAISSVTSPGSTNSPAPHPAPAPVSSREPTAVRDWAESDSDEDEEGDLFDVDASHLHPPAAAPAPVQASAGAPSNPFGRGVVFKMLSRDQKGKVEARVFTVPEEAAMVQKLAQARGEAQAEKERLKQQTLALQEASDGNAPPGGGIGAMGMEKSSTPSGMGLDEYLHSVRQDEIRQAQSARNQTKSQEDPPLKARDLGKW